MKWCTYITFHETGLFYIGKTSVKKINDGYQGSGRYLRKVLTVAPQGWCTEIVNTFETEKAAYDAEKMLVTRKVVADPLCLNAHAGGNGNYHSSLTDEQKAERLVKMRERKALRDSVM